MIDFYWLKSFTESIQLFISILLLIYLRVKYPKWEAPIQWLVAFLLFKTLEDLYGIINYTSWIEDLLTRQWLNHYRRLMGFLEIAMLTCLIGFTRALSIGESFRSKHMRWFIPAVLLIPTNFVLSLSMGSSLLEIFLLVRVAFIVFLIFFFLSSHYLKQFRFLYAAILAWNVLWLAEVQLHEVVGLISEPASWVIFVLAEVCLTVGITYFFIQLVAQPNLLRYSLGPDEIPLVLQRQLDEGLDRCMQQEKLYRNSDLTLHKLSGELGISPQDLTQYLNRVLGQNFNQYLIRFRIAEAKLLLERKTNAEMNIQEVMNHVGFNSKSVFNTAFKSETGQTPSEYRRAKTKDPV